MKSTYVICSEQGFFQGADRFGAVWTVNVEDAAYFELGEAEAFLKCYEDAGFDLSNSSYTIERLVMRIGHLVTRHHSFFAMQMRCAGAEEILSETGVTLWERNGMIVGVWDGPAGLGTIYFH